MFFDMSCSLLILRVIFIISKSLFLKTVHQPPSGRDGVSICNGKLMVFGFIDTNMVSITRSVEFERPTNNLGTREWTEEKTGREEGWEGYHVIVVFVFPVDIYCTHRVWKHRLNEDGNMKGHRTKFELGNTLQNEEHLKEFPDKKMDKE